MMYSPPRNTASAYSCFCLKVVIEYFSAITAHMTVSNLVSVYIMTYDIMGGHLIRTASRIIDRTPEGRMVV